MKKIIIMLSFLYGGFYLIAQDYQYIQYKNEQIMQTEKYQRGNDYQKDFLLLMKMLQTTHPTFAPNQQYPFDIDSLTKKGYKHLGSCDNLSDFQFFISSQLTPLHDGHTFIKLFQENEMNVIYPVQIWLENNIPYIIAVEKEHEAGLEKQVVSINGFSVLEIYSKFGNILVAENEFFLKKQIFKMILLPNIWNYICQNKNDSLLHFTFYDGTSIQIKAKSMADINEVAYIEPENQNSRLTEYQNLPLPAKTVRLQ